MPNAPWRLFERFGVELEYMIVDRRTLAVAPIAERVLRGPDGVIGDVETGRVCWSNELVAHVIELKNSAPAPSLDGLAEAFARDVHRINVRLAEHDCCLMPTAMHPTMNPDRETVLWSHDFSEVYQAFNRIFDCRGHGWANLQSTHLNLSFGSDEEFGRLHAAIRVLLPILPALTASSPIVEGRVTGLADTRLETYRHNARRVPSVAGAVVPEPVFTRAAYEREILGRIYSDLEPHDPEGVLRDEFANARGAIARFSRGSIEIRVLDVQECPSADLAILRLIVETLRGLVEERWSSLAQQQEWQVEPLAGLLWQAARCAEKTALTTPGYAQLFRRDPSACPTLGDLLRSLYDELFTAQQRSLPPLAPLQTILSQGCLAHRILARIGPQPTAASIHATYRELAECLSRDCVFQAEGIRRAGGGPAC